MIDGVNQFWEICIFAIWRARGAARLGVRAVRGLSFLTPPEKGQMFPLAESFSSVLKSGAEAEAIAQDNLDAQRRDCLNSDGSVRPLLRPAAVRLRSRRPSFKRAMAPDSFSPSNSVRRSPVPSFPPSSSHPTFHRRLRRPPPAFNDRGPTRRGDVPIARA